VSARITKDAIAAVRLMSTETFAGQA